MTDNPIDLTCSETLKGLLIKYKDDEYMTQRIYNHIVNYLPNTLDNEMKNHEKRIIRNNYLTNEQQLFIQVFLSKNKYFYLPNNNFFYEYDGEKYLIVKEDDVIHKLLSSISKDRVLLQWKYKTKSNIIKQIKERSLFSSIPETDTIQNVLNVLYPSFFPSKNLGCYGDGGAICTNSDDLAAKMRMIANHGQSQRYYHDVVGCNSRLDTIQAAVLRIKLKELENYIEARRKAADFYDAFFASIPQIKTPVRNSKSKHVFHQYTLQLEGLDRNTLSALLAEKEIPSMIYYPVPAHRQKMFSAFGSENTNLPITDWLTERVLSLPIHTELQQEQLEYICISVKEFITSMSK